MNKSTLPLKTLTGTEMIVIRCNYGQVQKGGRLKSQTRVGKKGLIS